MQHFIGRKRELHVLEAEYAKPSSFVVIYGRRRVGKNNLIKEFIKDKQALYFLATQESESQSMKGFTASWQHSQGKTSLKLQIFPTGRHSFGSLSNLNQQKKVLIIDEFQYLVQTNPAFPSIFQKPGTNFWRTITSWLFSVVPSSVCPMVVPYTAAEPPRLSCNP